MVDSKILIFTVVILLICQAFSNENIPDILDALTTDQREALKQVRPIALKIASEAYMTTDPYLVRWLQVFDFDVEKTLYQFQKIKESRSIHKINGILLKDFPLFIQEEFPVTFSSYDGQGRPVVITGAGKFNMRRTSFRGQSELMHRFGIMLLELMEVHMYDLQCDGRLNSNILPQIVVIFDLAGTNAKNAGCIACVSKAPKFIQAYNDYFGDMVRQTFLINVPRIMEIVLTTLISFLPPKIQQTVHVYGLDKSEWSEAVLRHISFDQLPVAYGGGKILPKNPKLDKSVWNWNNPALEATIQEYRINNGSHSKNCISKATNIESTGSHELDSSVNVHVSTKTPTTEHRHRHHHGENIPTDAVAISAKNDFELDKKFDDDWFNIDNSWIDEDESAEDSSSETWENAEHLMSPHDSSKHETNSKSNFDLSQPQVSRGHDSHKVGLYSILIALLVQLTLVYV